MANRKSIFVLVFLSLFWIGLYLIIGLDSTIVEYLLPRRISRLLGIGLVALTVGVSTVIFQSLTNNRILTPSMLGLDSMYMLIQTVLVFFLSSNSAFVINSSLNYMISVFIMVSTSIF